MENNLFSTKFILAVLCGVSFSVSFWLGRISPEQYIGGLSFSQTLYYGANMLLKYKKPEENKSGI